jgi:glutamyl-tRNA synthetase
MGGARTALFNWLLAKHSGGRFILRIEDTDRKRSTTEFLDAILEDHRWLGLVWDEGPKIGGAAGPYFQSERADTYAPLIQKLLDEGSAYRCFCSPEELDDRRSRSSQKGHDWKYDRKCAALSKEQSAEHDAEGRSSVVRFRIPDGKTSFDDMVLGPVEVDNQELDDLVIARSDGTPTYNFVVVVDDSQMGITHVVRGSDHLSNTPKQILIAKALGTEPPEFGHLPLVFGPDKQVLSKRRGAVAIGEYRRRGYLPEALVNYMALLGWSCGGEQEFFSLDELVAEFDISKVSRKAAAFDPEKLAWMNAQWIKRLSVPERTARVVPFLAAAGLVSDTPDEKKLAELERIVHLIDDRLKTLADIVEHAGFFLAADITFDDIAVEKVLTKRESVNILDGLYGLLSDAPDFESETIEELTRRLAEKRGVGVGKVVRPVRVAVTGKEVSPGIFETLSLLGREKVLARLKAASELASTLTTE